MEDLYSSGPHILHNYFPLRNFQSPQNKYSKNSSKHGSLFSILENCEKIRKKDENLIIEGSGKTYSVNELGQKLVYSNNIENSLRIKSHQSSPKHGRCPTSNIHPRKEVIFEIN